MKILIKIKKLFKKKLKTINKIINFEKEYIINFLKTGKHRQMCLYDNDKLIIKGDYNFYGIYQPYTKLWIWASQIPGTDKKHINNIVKIKEFNYLFEASNDIKMMFYYQLLTQDAILISDDNMLQWINELILYLSNDIYFFNPINTDNNVQYLTFANIKEKYTK